jgi:hypothetical protein
MDKKIRTSWVRFILMTRPDEKGFALPMAMGMGLFLILIAMMMMYRSQGDRVSANTQQSTTRGLSAAETGVTRYQDLINQNRAIATYPNSGTTSWANPSGISGISGCSTTTTTISTYSSTAWQDVDPIASGDSDAAKEAKRSKGQYKLVSYAFVPDTGTAPVAPGTATLIVEGRVNQSGSGSTATKDIGTSTSRLQVSIPVTTTTSTLSDTGLWATDFSFSGSNPRANANVLDSSCSGVGSSFVTNPYLGNLPSSSYPGSPKGTYTKQVISFPTLPGGNTYSVPTGSNINTISACQSLSGSTNITLPRTGDVDSTGKSYGSTPAPASNATYTYNLTCSSDALKLTGNARLNFGRTGQETIKVYVNGNVDAAGNGGMGPATVSGSTTKAIFYVNGSIKLAGNGSAFSPTYFQFYKYGTSGSVKLNGNGSSSAFIFAPYVETELVGNADISGVVWTKKIKAVGNASINQGKFDLTALDVTPTVSNVMGSPSSWQRQQPD